MDSEGTVVSLTQSIERVYGSKAAAEGLGFLYNNYLREPFFFGSVHAVLRSREGKFQRVADPRRDGTAEGF